MLLRQKLFFSLRCIQKFLLFLTIFFFCAFFSATAVDAKDPEPKRILTIYSYHEGLPWEKQINDSLQTTLASKSTEPIEFMRPWTEKVYGIPPEQVVGSSIKTKYEMRDSGPVLVRLPEMNFIDDKEGKPVGINQHIGRRPIAAFGNSDGDRQMLEWASGGDGLRFALLVHHTDAEREYAYDKGTEKVLEEAHAKDWTVVDMKRDWNIIYPPAKK